MSKSAVEAYGCEHRWFASCVSSLYMSGYVDFDSYWLSCSELFILLHFILLLAVSPCGCAVLLQVLEEGATNDSDVDAMPTSLRSQLTRKPAPWVLCATSTSLV